MQIVKCKVILAVSEGKEYEFMNMKKIFADTIDLQLSVGSILAL
ncbi:hypothetical protein [Clostridium sp. OS1-26]|nr:hypothetical protein [Clostridium sp. OS1-26]WML32676.1 hypothetical protein RCG18_14980 [Clostridium sp. OS1-26]